MAFGNKLLSLGALAAVAATFNCAPAWARYRPAYRYCDSEAGDAVRPDIQALNRLKNRQSAPAANDINRDVSLASMVRPGDDRGRWSEHKAAQLAGYVADVKMGGVETVNCHARSAHGRDTHIDLTLSVSATDPTGTGTGRKSYRRPLVHRDRSGKRSSCRSGSAPTTAAAAMAGDRPP